MRDLVPNQFDPTLSPAEAMAACGPAAAVAFARANGRNPTIREALEMARTVGWTAGGGMAGPASQRALLEKMGVPSRMEAGVNWAKVQADVQSGNPVIISTPQHYFVASDYDPKTDKFYFGKSGTAFKAGAEWLSPAQVSSLGHGLQAMLFLDNPATPNRPPSLGGPKVMAQPLSEEGSDVQADQGVTDWSTVTTPLTPLDINRIAAANGGAVVGREPVASTAKIKNPDEFAVKYEGAPAYIDNPDPIYRIMFSNGKYVLVKGERDAAQPDSPATGNFLPTGGNALGTGSTGGGGSRSTSPTWHWIPDESTGGQRAVYPDGTPVIDSTTGEPITKGATAGRAPRTASQSAADDALADERAASAALARARTANVGVRPPSQVGVDEAHQGLYEAQKQKAQLDAIKAAQALIPAQQKAISDAMSTIDYIQTQLASGGLTLDEANQYSSSVQSYLGAALRGSTPEKEAIERNKQITERAQIGRDLLNQKLQSTATLTGNLNRDYQSLLTQNGGLLVDPGSYNPLAYARALGDELGGGPEMSDLAKALLAAATPSGVQPHPDLVAVGDNLQTATTQDQQSPEDQYDTPPDEQMQMDESAA